MKFGSILKFKIGQVKRKIELFIINHNPHTIDVPLFIPKTTMSSGWPADVPLLNAWSIVMSFIKDELAGEKKQP